MEKPFPKKCAICLRGCIDKIKSGHFKTIESIYSKGDYINICSIYESIKLHIIKTNPEYSFDFFIHCWNPDMESKMFELYNPKSSLFENQNLYKNIVKNKDHAVERMNGQKLGMSKSLDLMIDYSEMKNIKYDKVILYRPDVLLYKDMNLSDYPDNKIVCNDSIYEAKIGPFHIIMNHNNAKLFRNLINYKISYYDFSKIIIKNPIIPDNIKCGVHQEVLRKIKVCSIDKFKIDKSFFYKYGLNDAEIDLMTHI